MCRFARREVQNNKKLLTVRLFSENDLRRFILYDYLRIISYSFQQFTLLKCKVTKRLRRPQYNIFSLAQKPILQHASQIFLFAC